MQPILSGSVDSFSETSSPLSLRSIALGTGTGLGNGSGATITSDKPEDDYIEADFRTVELCRNFLKDYANDGKFHFINPFSGRRIKRGTGTFMNVYQSVKKYMTSLDEEEFHSPIKEVTIKVHHVKPNDYGDEECNMDIQINKDSIDEDWTIKSKKNHKLWLMKQEKNEKAASEKELYQWRNDLIMDLSENFEIKISSWTLRYPELYSFFDAYKPEVLQNKFLMNHVFGYDDTSEYFIHYLQNSAKLFLNKEYGYGGTRPHADKRYAPAMILFWIYSDFIKNARKYLKKNNKKLVDYLSSKINSSSVRITKTNLSSLAVAHFIFYTPPERLSGAKENYDTYFEDLMKTFFEWCNRESVYAKVYYRSSYCDFMSSRVKPYRYVRIHFDDFDRFDEIIQYVSNSNRHTDNDSDSDNQA